MWLRSGESIVVHRGCFHPARNVDIPGQSCSGVLILRCQYSLSSRWPTSRWTLLRLAWTILLHHEKDWMTILWPCQSAHRLILMGKVQKMLFLAHFQVSTVPTSVYTFQSLAPYHPPEVISLHARSSRRASKGLSVTRRSTSLGRNFPIVQDSAPFSPLKVVAQTKGKSVPRMGCQLTHLYRFQITKSSYNLSI